MNQPTRVESNRYEKYEDRILKLIKSSAMEYRVY